MPFPEIRRRASLLEVARPPATSASASGEPSATSFFVSVTEGASASATWSASRESSLKGVSPNRASEAAAACAVAAGPWTS